jgi:hypothetical protein
MSKARTEPTLDSLKARTIEEGDCWLWQGYIANNTPQVVSYASGSKRMVSVRRLLRELETGRVQPDGHYSNTCGNPLCVNPDHTIWRGQDAHMRAMAKKRRVSDVTANKLRNYRVNTGQAKLSESKAQEIRLSEEPGPVLAERYGVSRSWINRVKRGEVWRVLSSPFAGLFK